MVGYPEALTDPSYNGQILTLTYPLIGNYGVPDPSIKDNDGIPKFFESDKIQIRGLVVHELSLTASHWNLSMTLDEWMYNEKIPGISGIDTRELTKKLRTGGVMMAALVVSDSEEFYWYLTVLTCVAKLVKLIPLVSASLYSGPS